MTETIMWLWTVVLNAPPQSISPPIKIKTTLPCSSLVKILNAKYIDASTLTNENFFLFNFIQ